MRALPEANKQSEIRERADAARSGEGRPPPSPDSGAVLTEDDIDQRAQAHVEGRK